MRTQNVAVLSRHRRFHRLCRRPQADGSDRDAAAIPRADGTGGVPARGTLDKYLGDGLMATFGTPFTGDPSRNALRCAQAMIGSIGELKRERSSREPPIQRQHRIALWSGRARRHRTEPARIRRDRHGGECREPPETLTREYGCALIASDELVQRARAETGSSKTDFAHLVEKPPGLFADLNSRSGYGRGITRRPDSCQANSCS